MQLQLSQHPIAFESSCAGGAAEVAVASTPVLLQPCQAVAPLDLAGQPLGARGDARQVDTSQVAAGQVGQADHVDQALQKVAAQADNTKVAALGACVDGGYSTSSLHAAGKLHVARLHVASLQCRGTKPPKAGCKSGVRGTLKRLADAKNIPRTVHTLMVQSWFVTFNDHCPSYVPV